MIQSDYLKIKTEILSQKGPDWTSFISTHADTINRWKPTVETALVRKRLQEGSGGWGRGIPITKAGQYLLTTPSKLQFHYRVFGWYSKERFSILKSIKYI